MPIYEYACRTCAHSFETLVRGHEDPSCPHCHGADLERALSTFAVGGPAPSPPQPPLRPRPAAAAATRAVPGACSMN